MTLRKTKIVATIGPSINTAETLEKALIAGVDVCRVNCSHSDADGIRKTIALIRRVAGKLKRSVGVLLDLLKQNMSFLLMRERIAQVM